MAILLNSDTLKAAQNVLLPPVIPPSGDLVEGQAFPAMDFSSWLALQVEGALRENPLWVKSHPIAIGSWGLGELSVKSDLDVLFCGDEKTVTKLVGQMEKEKWPLRHRYPKNKEDWREGGNIFEVNALFWARPFTPEASALLQEQKQGIFKRRKTFRKKLLKEFQQERLKRNQRHDSITNYLEPNLKFGAGGLRDVQQAMMIWFWYEEKLGYHAEVWSTLNHLKSFILTVRQKMHLMGYGDALVAQAQFELSDWFGYKSQLDFMRELQKVLARVSFYCDWVFEVASSEIEFKPKNLRTPREVFSLLKKAPTLQNQAHVRHSIREIKGFAYNREFLKVFNVNTTDDVLRALYRAQVLPAVIPDYTKVMGVVQHDQYHRYTVGAHLLQAMRQIHKIYKKPNLVGKLKKFLINFKKQDWEILLWTALYHDLGKAREGDHSQEGKLLVEKDLPKFGFSRKFIDEVAWMVENHLVLSTAAFRKDPHSPKLWSELFDKGITGMRLRRLAMFTAIDIYSTNPEAWSSWKEKLLYDLVRSVETPKVNQFLKFKRQSQRLKLPIDPSVVESLDTGLLTSLKPKVLLTDLHQVIAREANEIFVYNNREDGLWVRFYSAKDEDGLFLKYVTRLWAAGFQIRHAYIHTLSGIGVYDWFHIRSNKTPLQIKKFLESSVDLQIPQEQTIPVDEVRLISESENEWVFGFRGSNKKGVLISAAQTLYDLGLPIRWAKVHTWGQQVDDTFGVSAPKGQEIGHWTQKLKNRLVKK